MLAEAGSFSFDELITRRLWAELQLTATRDAEPLDGPGLSALTTKHHGDTRLSASRLFGNVAQTHFWARSRRAEGSLSDVQMGSQWNSSGWTLLLKSRLERCAHP
ncbi:MAG: hypothetical protein JWM55_1827 [Acidimicrobiaceae bacterium]|nr:hypothetical protein [Acidimicrobiaceae bacterium]